MSYLGQDLSIQGIMLGQKLKELREEHQFVQREVAAKLEVDTAYVSKMENGTKQVSRSWLPILARMYKMSEAELNILWLADRIEKTLRDEPDRKAVLMLLFNHFEIDNR